MEKKKKSLNDVWSQMERCILNYDHFDSTGEVKNWMQTMRKIADFYLNNITRQVKLEHPTDDTKEYDDVEYSYAVRSYMPDTPLEVIHNLEPWKKKGLYVMYKGEKKTPDTLYFGIDTRLFREDGQACGRCYFHYDCALWPVYLPNGTHYREPQLSNVCADYEEDGLIHNFYRE